MYRYQDHQLRQIERVTTLYSLLTFIYCVNRATSKYESAFIGVDYRRYMSDFEMNYLAKKIR